MLRILQLLKICGHSAYETKTLLTPFWGSIAPIVVKDLDTRPQVAQRMCEVLNQDIASFLILTEKYTIPYLVLSKKHNVLQQIAKAHGPEGSVLSLLLTPGILTATLAYLLLQPSSDVESMAMALLHEALQSTQELDFLEMITSDTIALTVELLKVAGEREGNTRIRVILPYVILKKDTEECRRTKLFYF